MSDHDRFYMGGSVNKQIATLVVATVILAAVTLADAQQRAKIPKIGWLGIRPDSLTTSVESFRREFYALGHVEGKNFTFEYRSADNKLDRLPTLANELIGLKVDLLITPSTNEARAAKNATKTIPIVFSSNDPVGSGLVDSLARPGGNLTGFSTIASELGGKRLELLKETIPKLARVAFLWTPQTSSPAWKEIQLPAKELGLQLHPMEVSSADKIDSAFTAAQKAGSAALAVALGPLINSHQKRIVELAAKNRLPAIYSRADFVESGGLMSYGADQEEPYRRIAVMVDKILKGAKPADLPVEQPTKFEFIINLKAAKQIGLTIPPNVLARADKVIR
jgi:putative tryptophan/tyrosine transport system substrate-binding protein